MAHSDAGAYCITGQTTDIMNGEAWQRTVPRRDSGSSSRVWPSRTIPMSTTRLLVAPCTRPTTVAATLLDPTSMSTSMYPAPLPQHTPNHSAQCIMQPFWAILGGQKSAGGGYPGLPAAWTHINDHFHVPRRPCRQPHPNPSAQCIVQESLAGENGLVCPARQALEKFPMRGGLPLADLVQNKCL